MERNFVGLDSKDEIFNKDLEVEGCKQPDVFESFNNHPEREIEVAQVQHATKPAVPVMMNSVPAQLTIFYDGMVNVYDGVSPEKAQAIMRLAGNAHFVATADAPQQRTQAQGPAPTSPANTRPCSPVSSPISVSSHYVSPLTDGPHSETEAAKRIMSSLGQAMQSVIPQAHKASLARFLEKRKERVMASAPYSLSKNIMDCASNGNAAVVAGE